VFCPSPETFNEAEFKSNRLMNLAEDISQQHATQAMAWLLLAAG
jgi:hypothetical protein